MHKQHTQVIRGLAILAVVGIHVLAYLPGIYTQPDKQLFFIALDQLFRFCVPLFVLLSGYGLAMKYARTKISLGEFYHQRIVKLLPLYLLWSLFSYVVLQLIPLWQYDNQPSGFLTQLIGGQADYQMYFLPMIFQLYLFFPLVWLVIKRWPTLSMLSLMGLQLAAYIWYSQLPTNATVFGLVADRLEYIFLVSWIGYFGLGMWLSVRSIPARIVRWLPLMTLVALTSITLMTQQKINQGLDPLLALKFTRPLLMVFATLAAVSLATASWRQNLITKVLGQIGQHAYLIFLSHTMGLRIGYALMTGQIATSQVLLVFVVWLSIVVISKKYLIH